MQTARQALIELLYLHYKLGWDGVLNGKDLNDHIDTFLADHCKES